MGRRGCHAVGQKHTQVNHTRPRVPVAQVVGGLGLIGWLEPRLLAVRKDEWEKFMKGTTLEGRLKGLVRKIYGGDKSRRTSRGTSKGIFV